MRWSAWQYLVYTLATVSLIRAAGIVAAEATDPSRPGSIRGTVRFTGTVPPPEKITTTDARTIERSDLVVDPGTKGLRDVVIVLADAPALPKLTAAKPVLVDQREMLFVPRVVAVQHGRAVRFANSDDFNHSVLAASTVPENQLNVFVAQGRPVEHVFTAQKHPVQIGCSLHPWMRAWVYVVPHPWFAVTDDEGRFEVKEVPPGRYTVWLRHAASGLQERRSVSVSEGGHVPLTVEWSKVTK